MKNESSRNGFSGDGFFFYLTKDYFPVLLSYFLLLYIKERRRGGESRKGLTVTVFIDLSCLKLRVKVYLWRTYQAIADEGFHHMIALI